ncbi:hypothetical protein J1N35_019401 [Gossypium stocksii]|uniref:Uncharacterized protein n=1 Tax=Gossypium stocksii TaxID=47602 RepID=A0A9D3VQV7_9ROSI|nr:hypothetical protein J1N35_019401 [Gossypium stocksii]
MDSMEGTYAIVPPANALLLLGCQSTPVKSQLEEANRVEDHEKDQGDKKEC